MPDEKIIEILKEVGLCRKNVSTIFSSTIRIRGGSQKWTDSFPRIPDLFQNQSSVRFSDWALDGSLFSLVPSICIAASHSRCICELVLSTQFFYYCKNHHHYGETNWIGKKRKESRSGNVTTSFLFRLVALQKSIQHSIKCSVYTDVFDGNFLLKIAVLPRIASLRA